LGLRMIGPAMCHPHAEPKQPYRERRERPAAGVAPGPAIVHQHRIRQAVAPEHCSQAFARGPILLRAARLDAQSVTRMVIDHGERMAAPARRGEVALEVHLPELVGVLALEPLKRAWMLCRPQIELAMPAQNLRDRARRRHNLRAIALHDTGDLPPAPRVVAVLAD